MNFKKFLLENEEDYRGHHQAPIKDDNIASPFYNVSSKTYPDDFYTLPYKTVAQNYGSHHAHDLFVVSLIRMAYNKPDFRVKIYRAVPKVLTTIEKINEYEKQQRYILKTGKVPRNPDENLLNFARTELPKLAVKWDSPNMKISSAYYTILGDEIKKLQTMPQETEKKITINKGDWVTPSRLYAKEHGLREFGEGYYRILTKTVPAKHLFTNGDSLQEFGYDPS